MKPFLLLLALLSLPAAASTRTDPIGGPDGHAKPFAWFLQPGPEKPGVKFIRFCVQTLDPDKRYTLEHEVRRTFGTWQRFMNLRAAPWMKDEDRVFAGGIASYLTLDSTGPCQGDEDLTIYFGVEDDRVKAAKSLYDDPLGFAHLESYDEKAGWGRGFVWISGSPEASHYNHRFALLLHEIGHVFGNDHVAGTIMDAALAEKVSSAYKAGTPLLPGKKQYPHDDEWVNFERELLPSAAYDFSETVREGELKADPELGAALELLTGQKLTGKFFLRFHPQAWWKDEEATNFRPGGKGMLVVNAGREWKLKVDYGKPFSLPTGDQGLLRRKFRGRETAVSLQTVLQPGALKDRSGKSTSFVITRGSERYFEFHLTHAGKKLRVF